MKLCNKMTGEIVEVSHVGLVWNRYGMPAEIGQYDSLAELNEEWEDYKPKEPLIKDERIRKAVRAWAEANDTRESGGIGKVFFDGDEWEFKFSEFGIARIQFNRPVVPYMEDKEYTITELCGDEAE